MTPERETYNNKSLCWFVNFFCCALPLSKKTCTLQYSSVFFAYIRYGQLFWKLKTASPLFLRLRRHLDFIESKAITPNKLQQCPLKQINWETWCLIWVNTVFVCHCTSLLWDGRVAQLWKQWIFLPILLRSALPLGLELVDGRVTQLWKQWVFLPCNSSLLHTEWGPVQFCPLHRRDFKELLVNIWHSPLPLYLICILFKLLKLFLLKLLRKQGGFSQALWFAHWSVVNPVSGCFFNQFEEFFKKFDRLFCTIWHCVIWKQGILLF